MSFAEVLTPAGIAIGAVVTLLDILLARGAGMRSHDLMDDILQACDELRLSTGLTVLDMLEIEGLVQVERWDDNEIQRIVRRKDQNTLLLRAADIMNLDRCAAV